MSIITISRGSYCRGKEIAHALAQRLHYQCISREIVHDACKEFQIPERELVKALQESPSLFNVFSRSQERYVHFFKSAFLCHMTQGNIIYHGLVGQFFLQNIPHVLKIRINARRDEERLAAMLAENPRDNDEFYHLEDDTEDQRKKNIHLYGEDTWNTKYYDMVINMDNFSNDDIIEIVANTIKQPQFQETEASQRLLKRYALQAKVEAFLATLSPKAKVEVTEDFRVKISQIDGLLKSDATIRKNFRKKLKEMLHIKEVQYKEPTKAYKGHINNFYNLDLENNR